MLMGKLASTASVVETFKNWPAVFCDHVGYRRAPYISSLRNGLHFLTRPRSDDGRILFDVFAKGCYRPRAITKGGTVIDIGANIGAFSLLAAQRGAIVYAYEPHPLNLMLLGANCALNGFSDVHINSVCVAAKAGRAALYIPDNDAFVGRYSLYPGRGSRTVEVSVVSVKTMFTEVPPGPIDCIKLDCQGSEYEILYEAGAENLSRTREILVECDEFAPDGPKYSITSLSKYLQDLGFDVEAAGNLLHARRDHRTIKD